MTARSLPALLLSSAFLVAGVAGCAAPFQDVTAVTHGKASSANVSATYCGSSSYRADSVIRAIEPPLGESSSVATPKEVTFCVRVANRGAQPVRVDRSHVRLKCPREMQTWIPDSKDALFVVPAGSERKFDVTFHHTALLSGEDVSLLLDEVVSRSDRPLALPPIVARRR